MTQEKLDILIHSGALITMSENMDVIEDPFIGIRDGRILFVRNPEQASASWSAETTIDATGQVIMPGLVNTHTHLPMICFRGYADDLPLMEWLNEHIFPAEAKFVNPEMVYQGSLLAMAEMILSGTTTFCDAYFFEDRVARAALDSGMRAVVSQGFLDFPTVDNPEPARNPDIAESFVKTWRGVSDRITPALFCHSPYTCSPETLKKIKNIARREDVLYLTHLSETIAEVEEIKNRYGKTPVHHLEAIDVLDEGTVSVHCVWIHNSEVEILARHGVKVSHTPESNMKLATGTAPVPEMLRHGITVGLGTDGCASNNDLDLFLEMGTAAKIHKLESLDPTTMDARTTVRMATLGSARVLGLDDRIGSIEPGKRADIVLVDFRKPHLTPVYDYYSHIVYAASGSDVSTVVIDGKVVMRDRMIMTIDVADAMKKVREIAGRIAGAGNIRNV
ncbi:MAG: amidohydrolase [Deltaproteobacteria bacterium]|nr:amidohydrolase [Deltaproteobacteria bacterium]